jgi:hypothetical protein
VVAVSIVIAVIVVIWAGEKGIGNSGKPLHYKGSKVCVARHCW